MRSVSKLEESGSENINNLTVKSILVNNISQLKTLRSVVYLLPYCFEKYAKAI